MSVPAFEPPPTYAEPFILTEDGKKSRFNPIWIRWFIKLIAVINGSGGGGGTIQHSSLGGLQGGTTGQYYHLTAARYSDLTGVQLPNVFLGGPVSGGSAISAFRALVAADLPAGTGTVTSVAVTGANGIGVSGSPITSSGTIALSLGAITPTSVASSGAVSGTSITDS
jgi:hypothetical protein